MFREKHWAIIIQVLTAIVMILYLIGRENGLNVFLFWPIVWTLILLSFIIVWRFPTKYKLISLIILAVSISTIILAVLPEIYHMGRDGVFEAQFASIIAEEGKWLPTLGTGFAENYYGYNPVLHFTLSFASLTTGLSSQVLLKYYFLIFIRLMIVLLSLLLIKAMIGGKNDNISFLATLIFIGSAGMAFVSVTRRTTAAIFLLLTIYTILKSGNKNDRAVWNILFMIFSIMVILSNHSLSYYLLMFLFGAWIFSIFLEFLKLKESFPAVFYKLVYTIIIFFGWELFVTKVFIKSDLSYMVEIQKYVLSGEGIKSFFDVKGALPSINIYRTYETFIIYSSQLLFLLLGIIGLVLFIRYLYTKKTKIDGAVPNKYFLLYFAFFGFSMYVLSSILLRTEIGVAVSILLWFFCLPISIFIAYFLIFAVKQIILRKISIMAIAMILLVLYTGSLLMGIYTPRITNRAPEEDIVFELDSRSKTDELYFSAKWLAETSEKDVKILGDINMYEIFSGFFQLDVNPFSFWQEKLYLSNKADTEGLLSKENFQFGYYAHTNRYDRIDYVVINRAFLRYKSVVFGNPIDLANLEKFDEINQLDRVYDNNEVQIYKIIRDQ